MKRVFITLLLIFVALPASAQWRDNKFSVQVLAFGVHDTNMFLSNVPLDQGLPQSYLDSLVFRYQNGGWVALGSGLDRTQGNVTSFASLGRYFFAGMTLRGGPGAAYRSMDNGAHWVLNAAGYVCSNGVDVLGVSDGIYRSADSGNNNSWRKVTPFPANNLFAIGKYVLANVNGPLYRSADSGTSGTWITISTPISNLQSFVAVGSLIYAANGTQLIESTDSGGSWTIVSTNFPVSLLATDSVHLFAGGSSGVYYFDSQSGIWIYESGDSLHNGHGVVALGVFDTLLFADFSGAGAYPFDLYTRSIPEMTQESAVAQVPQSEDTIEVYPNPATTELSIFSGQNPILRVRLLNILGEEVLHARGADATRLDLSKLPSGTYFVQIQTMNGETLRKITKE